uniref:Uncharacterized protein n=1 Tax=Solanum lycopersicum TaxID=4081 RepID=A0A3Q7ITS0_SOLLC
MILQASISRIKRNTHSTINKRENVVNASYYCYGRFQIRKRRRSLRSMDEYYFVTMPRYCEEISQKRS